MKVKITIDGETVYETGYIKPNQHISEDFLQRNFYEHPDVECIKYVFFGLGIKPSEDLLWKGKKKDLS